jgi:phage head maturation protease
MNDFKVFLPIGKVDKDKRTVSGYASTPTKDSDGEIVTLDAIKAALPDYMSYANIREMHALKAIGVAQEANIDKKGLFLTAKIVDDGAWKKCLEGVYKGFSIGGRKLDKDGDKITSIELSEISVVDRPANPDCRITVAKSHKATPEAEAFLVRAKARKTPQEKALAKMAKIVGILAKEGPPAAHDGLSLPAVVKNKENETELDDELIIDKDDDEDMTEVDKSKTPTGKEKTEPYGDVEYADEGLREDKKKRYPIDTEEHIRAAWNYINKEKNQKKYSPADVTKVKNKIIAAWKAKIDKEGPPSVKVDKETKKFAQSDLTKVLFLDSGFLDLGKASKPKLTSGFPPELELKKGMNAVGTLAYTFDSIRGAQRSLMTEGQREGGDKKDHALAKELGTIAQQLASIISQKATHEGDEALNLSDVDDQYLISFLGEDWKMATTNNDDDVNKMVSSGDPLQDAVMNLLKRAAQPTKAARLAMAKEEVEKSRKAMKECRKALKEAHEMHKAAYIAKMAKAKKAKDKTDDDDDDFDHAGCMSKLQKAYEEASKARTFGKAAEAQLEKSMATSVRTSHAGVEVTDAEAGYYEIPPGIKELSPAHLAGAEPGTPGSSGMAPMYPDSGQVYPGKANAGGDLRKYAVNGRLSPATMELLLEKARTEGELEALRRVPASAGRRAPFGFDITKAMGSTTQDQNLHKSLFDGVNVNALNGQDEMAHTEASAKVIGNFLTSGQFGKSILDPTFRGAAGNARN